TCPAGLNSEHEYRGQQSRIWPRSEAQEDAFQLDCCYPHTETGSVENAPAAKSSTPTSVTARCESPAKTWHSPPTTPIETSWTAPGAPNSTPETSRPSSTP